MRRVLAVVLAIIVVFFLVALLASTAMAQAPSDLTTNLVSCWELDEASGVRVDSWGANDLTDVNTVGSTAGLQNNAADFERDNSERLTVADNGSLTTGDVDLSVYSLVNFESVSVYQGLVSKWGGSVSTSEFSFIFNNAGILRWVLHDGVVANELNSSFSPVSTATWYTLFAWHDAASNQMAIQVGTNSPDTKAHSGGVQDTTSSLVLGREDSGSELDGLMDTTALWIGRVLTSDERSWLHNSGAGRSCQDIADTVPTPTPTDTPTGTPTPSPTPTGTPLPTDTPTPGPKIYEVDLPSGGRGQVVAEISAGDAGIITVVVFLVVLSAYQVMRGIAQGSSAK